jgi:hypothetical protein
MKHKLLKSALCLCLLLPACNNQQEKTSDKSTAEKTVPAAIVAAPQKDPAPLPAEPFKTAAPAAVETPSPVAPATPAAAAPEAVIKQQDSAISGKVVETMNSGGYTYLQLDTAKGQQWVAIPESKVVVGDEVSCYEGMVMPNFTSKSLNRTFEAIIFSPGLVGTEGQAGKTDPHGMGMGGAMKNDMPNPHGAKPDTAGTPVSDSFASAVKAETPPTPAIQDKMESSGSLGAMAPFADVKIEKAAGENSYTVEEIFTNNTQLEGKTVRVQGKVVKFSPSIMGKNWIHLQDGSGDPLKSSHDLVITTNAQPPKDKEVITIEGIVRANKDFGAGYKYVVIVEEAQILP